MLRTLKAISITFFLLLYLVLPVMSQNSVPEIIKYSGTLTDASGNLIEGQKTMRIRLYSSFSGGSQLWSQIFTNIEIRNGSFSVLLGSGTALPDSLSMETYVQIEIQNGDDWEVMLPRVRVSGGVWADTTKSTSETLSCPDDMASAGLYCIDKSKSSSRMNFQEVVQYCALQGKRLCRADELQNACDHRTALGLADMIASSSYDDYEFSGDKLQKGKTIVPNYLVVNYYITGVDCTAAWEARTGLNDYTYYPPDDWCYLDTFDVPGSCHTLGYARCCK